MVDEKFTKLILYSTQLKLKWKFEVSLAISRYSYIFVISLDFKCNNRGLKQCTYFLFGPTIDYQWMKNTNKVSLTNFYCLLNTWWFRPRGRVRINPGIFSVDHK